MLFFSQENKGTNFLLIKEAKKRKKKHFSCCHKFSINYAKKCVISKSNLSSQSQIETISNYDIARVKNLLKINLLNSNQCDFISLEEHLKKIATMLVCNGNDCHCCHLFIYLYIFVYIYVLYGILTVMLFVVVVIVVTKSMAYLLEQESTFHENVRLQCRFLSQKYLDGIFSWLTKFGI